MLIVPDERGYNPVNSFSNVVLPLPLPPARNRISPAWIVNVIGPMENPGEPSG